MQAPAPVTLSSSIQRLSKVATAMQRVRNLQIDITDDGFRLYSKPEESFMRLLNNPGRIREMFTLFQDGNRYGNSLPLAFARFYSALNPPCLPKDMQQEWERSIFKGFQAKVDDFEPLLKQAKS